MKSKTFIIGMFPQYRDRTVSQEEALDINMNVWLKHEPDTLEIVRTDIGSSRSGFANENQTCLVVIVYYKYNE